MAPPKTTSGRSISQDAFDELVKENIDDLGMDPAEALGDAIQTLALQGVDLSGIAHYSFFCPTRKTQDLFGCLLPVLLDSRKKF